MFVDSHAHFDRIDGDHGLAALLDHAIDAGLDWLVAVGGEAGMNACAIEAATGFPDRVLAAVGYDRDRAEDIASGQRTLDALLQDIEGAFIGDNPVATVLGEIGLDFHYTPETAQEQQALFRGQLSLAREHCLPVIVHSREAPEETLDALAEHARKWRGRNDALGVLHCFTYGPDMARRVLALGYDISFSGIASFKNAEAVRESVRVVPDDRLLIETDTPYLAPVPFRGKRNEPAYVRYVAQALADVRGVSLDALAELTTRNAERLFGRPAAQCQASGP